MAPTIFLAAAFAAFAADFSSAQTPSVTLSISAEGALPMPRDWLGVNIDTASFTNDIDLKDVNLVTLARQLNANLPPGSGTTTIRIGGTASNGLVYLPHGQAGRGPGGSTILTDASLQTALDFAAATGSKVIFGMNYQRDKVGAWDPAINATALWARIASTGNGSLIVGYSLGNELISGGGFDNAQYAKDYVTFGAAVAGTPGIGHAVYGPSVAGFPGTAVMQPFMAATAGSLSAFSFHAYAFKNCSLEVYMSKRGIEHME